MILILASLWFSWLMIGVASYMAARRKKVATAISRSYALRAAKKRNWPGLLRWQQQPDERAAEWYAWAAIGFALVLAALDAAIVLL